ncbi:hypothetical protein C8Q74DRAFT_936240 [Fomes fomentarius]|nr:hypothetical protein C8Q74DRAFT_936240 [Fomes fomentarius]
MVALSMAPSTSALISLLATYLAGSNAQYVCLDSLQPLIGIVFTLIMMIMMRDELIETTGESSRGASVGADSRISAAPVHHPAQSQQYSMRPLAINTSVSKTHDHSNLEEFDDGNPGAIDVEKDPDLESGDRSTTLVPNRLHSVLSFEHPQRSHQPTRMTHTDLGSPFSPVHATHVQAGHGTSPCEPVVDSRSTPGEGDDWDNDDDLVGCVPTPLGLTAGTTTPEKTSRPSSFIPSTPVSASHDSDGASVKTSSTLPPSYRTRRSIPDLISASPHPLPPLPNQNNYPRAPPSAYPGALEFYQRPNTVVESGETLDDRQVLPNVPDHGGDSDDERRGDSRNGRQVRQVRKRSTDGGIRLDGGPVGYVPTSLQSPAVAVDVEDEFQAGSTRPPSYRQTS